jgi:hypothetical protein
MVAYWLQEGSFSAAYLALGGGSAAFVCRIPVGALCLSSGKQRFSVAGNRLDLDQAL